MASLIFILNIIIQKNKFRFILVDYGYSTYYKNKTDINEWDIKAFCDTLIFQAPEVLEGNIRKSSDLFSIGVAIYCLNFGKLPYKDIMEKLINMNYQNEEDRQLED